MIIYIDWDFKNILKMINKVGYNHIENILVYEEMNDNLKQIIPFSVTPQQYKYLTYLHTAYIDFFIQKKNDFANYLKQHSYCELTMPSNGLTEKHIARLYRLIDEKNENEKYDIIFRWSHVLLTVCEKLSSFSFVGIEIDEMAEYLFGSNERIEMLREMFIKLHSKQIEIFIILDMNDNKKNIKNIKNILKWVRYLYPSFIESNLIF